MSTAEFHCPLARHERMSGSRSVSALVTLCRNHARCHAMSASFGVIVSLAIHEYV